MKRFLNLFTQDFKITIRSGFHYVIIGLAVVFILLTHFVIPEQINTTPEEFFFDNTENRIFETFLIRNGADRELFYQDEQAFRQAVQENRGSIGIMISGNEANYRFEILANGSISSGTQNLIIADLDSVALYLSGNGPSGNIDYEYLREPSPPVPFNKSLLPVFITFEVIMMGFILIAVLVFQEKQEASIKAYRISASGTLQYILSKTAVITLLGLAYGFLTTVFIAGFDADYLALVLIILFASLFINFLGLSLSVFFNNISEFLIVSVVTLTLVQMPLVSYFNPSFSPAYLKWIPSYPVIFGVRDALFSAGKENYLWPVLWILIVETIVIFGLCYWAVKARLMSAKGRI